MKISGKLADEFIWILIILVISGFWIFAYAFSYNFPYYDDFENILLFIFNYVKTENAASRISLLFQQNFEHRVVFSKLLTLLLYYFTGQINFKWLIILGDLSLLGILYIFFQFYLQRQATLLALFTITCLLFQAQHYNDTISWATCSLQHAPCMFFSFSCYYTALNKKNLYISGVLALFALSSSANGLIAVFIWLMIIALMNRNWRSIFLPSVLVIATTLIHLLTLKIYSGSLMEHVISNTAVKFMLLLSFAGQIADSNLTASILPSVILGSLFLLPLIIVFVKFLRGTSAEINQMQWFCISGIVTLLFTAFLILFARGSEPDFAGYRMDRYKIYASLFSVLAIGFYEPYLSLFKNGSYIRYFIGVTSFLFCICSYYIYYDHIVHYRSEIQANKINYMWNRTILYPNIYADATVKNYLPFILENIFRPAKQPLEVNLNSINWKLVKNSIEIAKQENSSSIRVINNHLDIGINYEALYVVAVGKSNNHPKYLFTAINSYKRSIKLFYTSCKKSPTTGFYIEIHKNKIKSGSYNLYLVAVNNGRIVKNYHFGSLLI